MRKVLFTCLIIGLLLPGCYTYEAKGPELAQNWDENDRKAFYQTSQGSQILKYDWFLALEQPSSTTLFVEDTLQRFGYLPDPFASENGEKPKELPIGFVKDEGMGFLGNEEVPGPWIGVTCAACHTAEIHINGKHHLIDGAPNNADFYAFIQELSRSLLDTANQDAKFARFAARVSGDGSLRDELQQTATRFASYVEHSTPDEPWGKARMDAVALIVNEMAYKQDPRPHNIQVPNAPVSFPFLWDTHQQAQVQWNGVSLASLSRNTTQMLGAFSTFDPQEPKKNSINFSNLKDLQQLVVNLRSPRWENPEYGLPPIDKTRIGKEGEGRGKDLYKQHCQECHEVYPRDEDQPSEIKMVLNTLDEIQTDRSMAEGFANRTITLKPGQALPQKPNVVEAIASTLIEVWFKSIFGALIPGGLEELLNSSNRITEDLDVYKARPLNGIWATGPYLHNGAVKNIYQIMLPAQERDKTFCVGSRTFDSEFLGFESELANCEAEGEFVLETSIPGNLNTGHDGPKYGTDKLNHEARMDIIEFIKSE